MTIPRIAGYPMPEPDRLPTGRVAWIAQPARCALLIHDMQDYFLDFYDCAAAPVPALLSTVDRLRAACDAAGVPVFYTAQPAEQRDADRALLNDFWGPGLPAHPQRAGIVAPLAPRPHHVVLTKWRYSAFVRTDLEARLRAAGRDQLIVCGVYAHIGCQVTCVDAFMRDIQPILVGDALADFSPEHHTQALDYVAQRAGRVCSAAEVLAALGARLPTDFVALRAEVAALIEVEPEQLAAADDLVLAGLDSIRLMSLLTRWQQAGAALNFEQLAAAPTLAAWWALLAGAA